jgi:SLOG cluster2/TIR domain
MGCPSRIRELSGNAKTGNIAVNDVPRDRRHRNKGFRQGPAWLLDPCPTISRPKLDSFRYRSAISRDLFWLGNLHRRGVWTCWACTDAIWRGRAKLRLRANMSSATPSPLGVHIVLHDDGFGGGSETRALATEIYSRLARGAHPTGVSVIWAATKTPDGLQLPSRPILEEADRNAIILLIDWPFFEARRQWQDYLDALAQARRPGRDLLLPVSVCADAQRTATALSDINCVPVRDPRVLCSDEHLFQAIFTALLRLLGGPDSTDPAEAPSTTAASSVVLPEVFLCHSKADGALLARELRRYIYEETQLTCFFDTHNVPHGSGVRDFIRSSIGRSCLLVVWTDRLLESRWCQFEILEARKQQRPLLVLDALSLGSPRIFPFLGNMPVVRWNKNPDQVVNALLLELVRTRYLSGLFGVLSRGSGEAPLFMLHPPDIMETSSVARSHDAIKAPAIHNPRTCVYPDPPLPAEELAFLRETFPALHLHSISEWTALRSAGLLTSGSGSLDEGRPLPLTGCSIGLSISESESWRDLGLISEHQDDFAEGLSRELILLGGRIVWGGDLRPDGLGARLERLVRAYHQAAHAPQDHVACYLAWPNHHKVDPSDLQARRALADIICLPPPAVDIASTSRSALEAICYSMMRRELARHSDARIILGGKLIQYRGRYPGVTEEAFETVSMGGPIYIVGGFGGAAEATYEAITGAASVLAGAWHEHRKQEGVSATIAAYNELGARLQLHLRVDHDTMLKCFRELGPEEHSRRNKLTVDENRRLACSRDMREILALLVKGITRLRPRARLPHEPAGSTDGSSRPELGRPGEMARTDDAIGGKLADAIDP